MARAPRRRQRFGAVGRPTTGPAQVASWCGPSTSTQQLHACDDPEFRQGAACHERTLVDGSVLSVRGAVVSDGIASSLAVLTHPDGSGVGAESGSYELVAASAGGKPEQRVSRPDPTYGVQQLTALVKAVDAATR